MTMTTTAVRASRWEGPAAVVVASIAVTVTRWAGRVAVVAATLVFLLIAIGPHTGRYRTMTVLSASMRPTMAPGSVVVVTPMPIADIRPGDIITYTAPAPDGRVLTHRVIEVLGPGLVRTQGDANNTPDPGVAQLNGTTAWKARTQLPALGYAIIALRDPVAHLLTVGITTALGVLLGLRAIWRRPTRA